MKSTAIACVIAAVSLGFGSLSYAQGYDYGNRDGRSHDRNEHRDSRQGWQTGQYPQRQYEPRHLQPHYVNDWRAHHPYAPPYGYQWVRADDGGDFLLVAIATGLIANLRINQY
jgi:Ni/Co efflux regulator RcnB